MKIRRYLHILPAVLLAASFWTLASCKPSTNAQMGSITGTQANSNQPGEILDSSNLMDICSMPPPQWLDIASAASAPAMTVIEVATPPTLGNLGQESAVSLAEDIRPKDGFCSLQVSESFRLVINQALELVRQGKKAEARRLLETLMSQVTRMSADLASAGSFQTKVIYASLTEFKLSSSLGDRQRIRDLINAGEADIAAGGDGQAYKNAASDAFTNLANSELQDADFGDSMRLTEEALLLGEQEIADAASQRAKDIAEEELDAAIEDFDPCSASEEELVDLLNKLGKGMLLGLEGTLGPQGKQYAAASAKATTAITRLYNEAARKANVNDAVQPLPECELQADLEIEYVFAAAVIGMEPNASVTIPLNINWGLTPSPVSGNGQLVYDSTTTIEHCTFTGRGSWTIQVEGQVDSPEEPHMVELLITPSGSKMTFNIACEGSQGGTYLEPSSNSVTLPWQDGATVQSGYLWTFTLRLK